jgi:hypothetical protein
MTEGSRFLLYLLLAGVALLALPLVLALGPLGWIAAGVVGFGALLYQALRDDPDERTPGRTACPDCGAPNDPDAERCGYCDAAL